MSPPAIRPEEPGDYGAIAELHVRAFGGGLEAAIVALLRQHPDFDGELSLLAVDGDQVLGHALFFPYTLRLLGEDVPAVNLAPLAVDPAHQRRGVGTRLMEAGHAMARRKGAEVAFLLGHASYYPRFGYRTGAYGPSQVTVPVGSSWVGLPLPELEERGPLPADLPALQALWRRDLSDVDFALAPGPRLLDWVSPSGRIDARVYLRAGEIVGYARIPRDDAAQPRVFLAADAEAARAVAAELAAHQPQGSGELVLPVHPRARSAAAFGGSEVQAWNAAMACDLVGNRIATYLDLVHRGERPPGTVRWAPPFDLS